MTTFQQEFTGWLTAIPDNDRALLARLRQLTVDPDATVPDLEPWLTGEASHDVPVRTVAGLYALYPHHGATDPCHNIGWSARKLLRTISPQGDSRGVEKQFRTLLESDPHRIERRFMQVLDSTVDEQMIQLIWFVQMFRRYDVPVNWTVLLDSLDRWYDDVETTKRVKMEWSRMFWGSPETIAAMRGENQ